MILIKLPNQQEKHDKGFPTLQEAIKYANSIGFQGKSEKDFVAQGIIFSIPEHQAPRNFIVLIEKGTKSDVILSYYIGEFTKNGLELISEDQKNAFYISRDALIKDKENFDREIHQILIENNYILKNEPIFLTHIRTTSAIKIWSKRSQIVSK